MYLIPVTAAAHKRDLIQRQFKLIPGRNCLCFPASRLTPAQGTFYALAKFETDVGARKFRYLLNAIN